MQSPRYLFRRSKRGVLPTVWPVGVRGWGFLLACNLAFLLGAVIAVLAPFGAWTLAAAGLALLSAITLFAGISRHTDWTFPPPEA